MVGGENPSSYINREMADLRIIRVDRQLQKHNVTKHIAAIEAAHDEQPAVVQHGAVVPAAAGRQAVRLAAVPRHGDQVEQQHVVAVLVAVVAADDEQVRAHNGGSVREAAERHGDVDELPDVPLHVVDPHVVEALAAVRPTKDDELAADHVRRVVAASLGTPVPGPGDRLLGTGYQSPRHLGRVADIEPPYIVEGTHAVTTAKDVDAILVQARRVGTTL